MGRRLRVVGGKGEGGGEEGKDGRPVRAPRPCHDSFSRAGRPAPAGPPCSRRARRRRGGCARLRTPPAEMGGKGEGSSRQRTGHSRVAATRRAASAGRAPPPIARAGLSASTESTGRVCRGARPCRGQGLQTERGQDLQTAHLRTCEGYVTAPHPHQRHTMSPQQKEEKKNNTLTRSGRTPHPRNNSTSARRLDRDA